MNESRKYSIIISVIFIASVFGSAYYFTKSEMEEKKSNYNWSYELACENGEFQVAHNILTKLKKEVLAEKENEKLHPIKKEKKSHWFKDDEYVVDSISLEDHNQFMQGLQNKGRTYLAGLDYVYNAEIAYVKEMSDDDSSEKIKHLLSELRTNLLLFKSLEMESEAQEVYNKLAVKVEEQSLGDNNIPETLKKE